MFIAAIEAVKAAAPGVRAAAVVRRVAPRVSVALVACVREPCHREVLPHGVIDSGFAPAAFRSSPSTHVGPSPQGRGGVLHAPFGLGEVTPGAFPAAIARVVP